MKRILLVDNYDSFTYNLAHYLEALGCDVDVVYNDQIPEEIEGAYEAVVLSPGPGLPEEAGGMMALIEQIAGRVPIFGVCLGMQALAQYFGGTLYNQRVVKHGIQESIYAEEKGIFSGIADPVKVGLYHSWAVNEEGNYEVIARSESGTVMALQNRMNRCTGVQFHPESVMTEHGKQMLENFLEMKWTIEPRAEIAK